MQPQLRLHRIRACDADYAETARINGNCTSFWNCNGNGYRTDKLVNYLSR